VFEQSGIAHGPADALDQLTGKVLRLEIRAEDPLSVNDCAGGILGWIGDYENLGHRDLLD
jgi:hypothetical protein